MIHSPETIRAALAFVPSDDRETWIEMGMAVKSELGDGGFDLWDAWSQSSDSYNSKDAAAQWRSFKEGGGITIGTLFHEAKQHGFKMNGHAVPMDPAEAERIRLEREVRQRNAAEEEQRSNERAAKLAKEIYEAADDAPDDHPYLKRKGIKAAPGLRVGRWWQVGSDGKQFREKANCLLIPMRDTAGQIWNLQAIFPEADPELERDRDFLFGGRKKGLYFSVGSDPRSLTIGEGFATVQSIGQSTRLTVVCAFDRGNLLPVAKALRGKYPDARITLAADNDVRPGKPNYGLESALDAARAVDGALALPEMEGAKCDFNDLYLARGAEAVKAAIEAAKPAAQAEPEQPQQHDERNPPPELDTQPAPTWPEPLDLEALAELEPERPNFIIADWLPVGYATLLAGHGGVGKSGIALNLAVCIAAGVPFFGMDVQRRRVLYLSCEDRAQVLHWRLTRICAHLGVDMASLRGWLEVMDLVGLDTVLWERDPRTGNTVTPALGRLEERIRLSTSEIVVVDGISDTFAGNENARTDVKRYVNSLVALIPQESGAVLLVGHIAKIKTGQLTSEGYSGSTGWHNSVRARWYLYPETEQSEDGPQAKTGDLILELQKSNLGRTNQEMRFTWDEHAHLFVGRRTEAASSLERSIRERTERKGILAAFRGCVATSPEIVVPAAMQGPRTAYHVLSLRPEFPDSLKGSGKGKTRRFSRHIEELRQIRAIEEREYRRSNRHPGAQLVLTTEGMRQCVE